MDKKFALIDQSIQHAGGHHLEYALRVLDAARSQGMETVLGTHRLYEPSEDALPFSVTSSFTHTFWENSSRPSPLGDIRLWAGKKRGAWRAYREILRHRLYNKFLISKAGLDFQRAREVSGLGDELLEILDSDMVDRPSSARTLRLWRIGIWLVLGLSKVPEHLKAAARSVVPARLRRLIHFAFNTFKRLIRTILFLVKLVSFLVAAVILAPFALIAWIVYLAAFRRSYRKRFATDLREFMRNSKLEGGDVVFVPTLGETELLGLMDVCRKEPLAKALKWRLLYRRNLYHGRSNSYARQNDHVPVRRWRLTLQRVRQRMQDVDLRFYTDTEQLTEQYNIADIFAFKTAPIPVPQAILRDESPASEPLVAAYIGDARDEKGYPILSEMMDHVYPSCVAPGKLKLLAQSNFNVPHGEPGTLNAHLSLRALPTERCELVYGPFDSGAYAALFKRADILLVIYDQDNYAARSSGIFAEALTAGIPTIVTRGTWMALVLERYRQAYLDRLWPSLPATKYQSGHEVVTGMRRRLKLGEATQGYLGQIKGLQRAKTHLTFSAAFNRPVPAHHLVVEYRFFRKGGEPVGTIEETLWLYRSELRTLTPVPDGADLVDIRISNLDPGVSLVPEEVSVAPQRLRAGVASAFSGRIVSPTAFAVAEALSEMVRAYPAYQEAASGISGFWQVYNSASALVQAVGPDPDVALSPEHEAEAHVAALFERVTRLPVTRSTESAEQDSGRPKASVK